MKLEEFKSKSFPDSPGVYFFLGKEGEILYVGKATSLKDRVRSYFNDDVIHSRGPLIVDMVTEAKDVDYLTADSVLEALILEANQIKKWMPRYNVREKDDKSFNQIVITNEDYPRVLVVRSKDVLEHFPKKDIKYVFGPYPQGLVLKEGLRIIRRIFPFRDEKCEPLQGKPCFSRQVGLCPGVCTGEISKKEYQKTIQNLKLFFEGKKKTLLGNLEKQMKAHAKAQEFEKANEIKKTIFALTHIQDVVLIKAEKKMNSGEGVQKPEGFFRIEAYDVAHMSGQNTGGVMVVLEDKHVKKSDYRMFKIRRTEGPNDIAGLKETIDRRLNHPEWTFPNLIVVDGGIAHLNAATEVLQVRGFDIAVVAVTKNEKHKPVKILGNNEELIRRYQKEILLVNSEAHRFAIKYHRRMRKIV